jgi:hypothetical protein
MILCVACSTATTSWAGSVTTPYIPSPFSWSAAEVVKSWELRNDVTGLCQLLLNPPLFSSQQLFAGQNVGGSLTAVILDSDLIDNFGGHLPAQNPTNYYGQLAGYYLCQGQIVYNYTGTSLRAVVAIGASRAGGAVSQYIGGYLDSNTGDYPQPGAVAKLIQMTNVGTLEGSTNDYVQLIAGQESGNSLSFLENAANFPWMTVRWVGTGTPSSLAAPLAPAWPQPPTVLGHTFMNTNVRDTVNFLTNPPMMECYLNGSQNLASQSAPYPTVGTTVHLDTIEVDNYSGFNTTSHTYTVPVAGVYYVYTQFAFAALSTTSYAGCGITVTSSNYGGSQITLWSGQQEIINTGAHSLTYRRRLRLNAQDTILFAGFQNDTGSNSAALENGLTGVTCRAIVVWLPR